MSEFAYIRFQSLKMLTQDEIRDKDEIVSLTEQVLDARGLECDARIAKMPEDQVREILEEVRRLRLEKKKKFQDASIEIERIEEDDQSSGHL
jgi:ABC-type phosphate transport system auxiliary subunit